MTKKLKRLLRILWILLREALMFLLLPIQIVIPKKHDQWLFGTANGYWEGNLRAVFYQALEEGITCIIYCFRYTQCHEFQREFSNHPQRQHIRIVWRFNPVSFWYFWRSKVCLFAHDVGNINYAPFAVWAPYWGHVMVNVWHGIPIKAIKFAPPNRSIKATLKHIVTGRMNDYVIASSHIDKLAMSSCFLQPPDHVWVTGLPRNDWLYPEAQLPAELQATEEKLLQILAGRKLVLYAPTWREWDEINPFAADAQFDRLAATITKHGAVLGVRRHAMATHKQKGRAWNYQCSDHVINCDHEEYPETQVLLRNTDILITDYSSLCLDFALRNKPIIGFCYDYDVYRTKLSWLYNFTDVFPGLVTYDLDAMLDALNGVFVNKPELLEFCGQQREYSKRIFFDFDDPYSTKRLIDSIFDKLK